MTTGVGLACAVSFLVTVTTLPMGLLRMVALGSGGFERTRTMRISAYVALGTGVAALVTTIVLGIVLITR